VLDSRVQSRVVTRPERHSRAVLEALLAFIIARVGRCGRAFSAFDLVRWREDTGHVGGVVVRPACVGIVWANWWVMSFQLFAKAS